MSIETLPPMVCGLEDEMSIIYLGPRVRGRYTVLDPAHFPSFLVNSLPDRLYKLQQFLSNGARYYLDLGGHVEWATPECTTFEDIVAYQLAGEEVALHGLRLLQEKGLIASFRLNKRVVDSNGNHWGAHENYQIPRSIDPSDPNGPLLGPLATHLATRNVLVGAGKVTSAGEFMIAQKVFSLNELFSCTTTRSRGLINTRDEPHDDKEKYRRLHLINGDANVSPWSIAMKFGTTAVLLRMVQEGWPLDDLNIENADYAGKIIAADPTLQTTVVVASGKEMTAAEITAEYAARAKAFSLRYPLPECENEIIDEWQWSADQVQFDRTRLMDLSDWVTKQALVEHYRESRPRSEVQSPDGITMQRAIDIQFDSLGEKPGPGVQRRANSGFDMDKVATAVTEPPSTTRAYLRGNAIRNNAKKQSINRNLRTATWEHITFEKGNSVKLTARQTKCEYLEKMTA